MPIKWAVRELINYWRLSLLFIINLSIGLMGFVGLDLFKSSVENSLKKNEKQILSADLAVSVRRLFTDQEIQDIQQILGSEVKISRVKEFFSMLTLGENSRLVQVKVIDGNFPFYGEIQLGSGKIITEDNPSQALQNLDQIWVYPELLVQMGAKLGDQISLGQSKFIVADTIEQDLTQTFRLASMAPKIFMPATALEKTKLISKGSTLSDVILIKFIQPTDVAKVAQALNEKIKDPAIRVTTPEEASQDTARLLKYLSDYLGLSALVGLFLSLIGGLYLFRVFINKKIKSVAIMNTLGLPLGKAQLVTVIQIFLLTLITTGVTLIIARLLAPSLNQALSSFSPVPFEIEITMKPILQAFIISAVGCISFFIPVLFSMTQIAPVSLLRDRFTQELKINNKIIYLFFIPLLVLWLLSVWQSNSIKVANYFLLSLFGCAIILMLLSLALIWFLKRLSANQSWPFHQATLSLTRHPVRTISVVSALGLGTLLLTMIPQIKSSIQQDLQSPGQHNLPSFFMFDIQDEQVEGLRSLVEQQGLKLQNISPMVQARILTVNGELFEKSARGGDRPMTREEENELRFRNRGFNLSYRDSLADSEQIVAGKIWQGPFDVNKQARPWISVEKRFAERLNFKIGDVLLFDVQGVQVEGEVTSLRTVKWNSFQPNFFVQFQPGVLEGAPKSYLASLPAIGLQEAESFQRRLVKEYPNISLVDVKRAIDKIFSTIDKMSWSLELMAGLCFFVGLVVLFSISSQQMNERSLHFALLKTLGAKYSQLQFSYAYEFFILGLASALAGSGLSVVMSFLISKFVFETNLNFQLSSPVIGVLMVSTITMLTAFITAIRVLKLEPQKVFQDLN